VPPGARKEMSGKAGVAQFLRLAAPSSNGL